MPWILVRAAALNSPALLESGGLDPSRFFSIGTSASRFQRGNSGAKSMRGTRSAVPFSYPFVPFFVCPRLVLRARVSASFTQRSSPSTHGHRLHRKSQPCPPEQVGKRRDPTAGATHDSPRNPAGKTRRNRPRGSGGICRVQIDARRPRQYRGN